MGYQSASQICGFKMTKREHVASPSSLENHPEKKKRKQKPKIKLEV